MKPPSDSIPQPESISAQVDAFIKLIEVLEQAAYERGYNDGHTAGYNKGWHNAEHYQNPPTGADA